MRKYFFVSLGSLAAALLLPGTVFAEPVVVPPAAPAATVASAEQRLAVDVEGIDRQYQISSILKDIAAENLRRLRRAVVVGPHLGVFGGRVVGEQDRWRLDGGISGGLGLYFFRVPMTFELQDTIGPIVRQRVAEKIHDLVLRGAPPSAEQVQALASQIYADTKDELLGRRQRPPETFEKPLGGLYLDVARQFREGEWQFRLGTGLDVASYFNLGLVLGGVSGRRLGGLVGLEGSTRLLPSGQRSVMYEPFLRAEYVARSGEDEVKFLVGLRMTYDLL